MLVRLLPMLLLSTLVLTACEDEVVDQAPIGRVDDTGGGGSGTGDDGGGDDTGIDTLEHCGSIDEDETWGAESIHLVTCNVEVERGTLTLEAGVEVHFVRGAAMLVGSGDSPASLVVTGSAEAPVRMRSDDPSGEQGYWKGLQLKKNASDSTISYLVVQQGGSTLRGGIHVEETTVHLDHVMVKDAESCGLWLTDGAQLAEGSSDLTLTENGGAAACATADAVHSLPSSGSSYTGNVLDEISVSDSDLNESVTWSSLGVPYVLTESIAISGTAENPAVLTIEAPNTLKFANNKGLTFSGNGGASGLVVDGSDENPVLFTAQGAEIAGSWDGITIRQGGLTDHLLLRHVTIEYGGSRYDAALYIEDSIVVLDTVTVRHSETAGIGLVGRASFGEGSQGIVATDNARPLFLPPNAVGSIPLTYLQLTGNEDDDIWLEDDDGEVTETQSWPNFGVDYVVETTIKVEGSAEEPAILTIEAGNILRFGNNKSLLVSKAGGAAGLMVEGTEASPVQFQPNTAYEEGAWGGIRFYENASDESCVLEHFEVGYGGGGTVSGAIHVADAAPTLRDGWVHHSETAAIYDVDGGTVIESVTCNDNLGDESLCTD